MLGDEKSAASEESEKNPRIRSQWIGKTGKFSLPFLPDSLSLSFNYHHLALKTNLSIIWQSQQATQIDIDSAYGDTELFLHQGSDVLQILVRLKSPTRVSLRAPELQHMLIRPSAGPQPSVQRSEQKLTEAMIDELGGF